MEQDLIQAALADAGMAAVFGDNIHWLELPQGVDGDAVVIRRATPGRTYTMGGRSPHQGPLLTFEIRTRGVTRLIAAKEAVLAFTDTLRTAPFQGAFVEAEREGFDPELGIPVDNYHYTDLDVRVWHQPA